MNKIPIDAKNKITLSFYIGYWINKVGLLLNFFSFYSYFLLLFLLLFFILSLRWELGYNYSKTHNILNLSWIK